MHELSDAALTSGDEVRAFGESHGAAMIKLDDDDWAAVTSHLSRTGQSLAGRLFLGQLDAEKLRKALSRDDRRSAFQALAGWLAVQTCRKRSLILLSS